MVIRHHEFVNAEKHLSRTSPTYVYPSSAAKLRKKGRRHVSPCKPPKFTYPAPVVVFNVLERIHLIGHTHMLIRSAHSTCGIKGGNRKARHLRAQFCTVSTSYFKSSNFFVAT